MDKSDTRMFAFSQTNSAISSPYVWSLALTLLALPAKTDTSFRAVFVVKKVTTWTRHLSSASTTSQTVASTTLSYKSALNAKQGTTRWITTAAEKELNGTHLLNNANLSHKFFNLAASEPQLSITASSATEMALFTMTENKLFKNQKKPRNISCSLALAYHTTQFQNKR